MSILLVQLGNELAALHTANTISIKGSSNTKISAQDNDSLGLGNFCCSPHYMVPSSEESTGML